jgi:hypothetical protein
MEPARWVTAASLVGLAACANVWGFANLTSEDRDGGAGPGDGGAGDGGGEDGTLDADGAAATCNLANSAACHGKCTDDASPCGCLVDLGTRMTSCGLTGSGSQGATCSSDPDCAPGYGCYMATGRCSHWCRPASTTCPAGTSCHTDPTLIFNNGEQFGFCY